MQLGHLIPAICQKLEFRRKPCEGLQTAIGRKEARLAALWKARLSHQMTALLRFEEVFRAVRRTLRQAKLP
jgi:23S rRNA pseudoU1915 N3-methylase RlmH